MKKDANLYGHAPIAGRCVCAVSNGPRSFGWHQCGRPAVTAGFCKQHSPDAVLTRKRAAVERYERRVAERNRPRTERDIAVRALKSLLKAWDQLPAGYHDARTVGEWLADDMKPAVAAARKKLKEIGE